MRPVFVTCAESLGHFAADVTGVPLVDNIQKGGKLGRLLVVAVYSAVYGDEADTKLWEPHFRIHTHFQIVTAKTGKVFHHHAIYAPRFNIGNHPLKIRAVKVRPTIPIVYIFIYYEKPVLLCIAAQHHALGADGVTFPGIFIVTAQAEIESGVIYGLFHKIPPSKKQPPHLWVHFLTRIFYHKCGGFSIFQDDFNVFIALFL